ncbi:hypothetical protein LCGC14_1460790 [marine sediment metagenome]|uniref:Uncharacterized protein n=1 Tax=marine sediment metagenome TaxID=412755 RepID=A0A0F9MH80_9ZZZZ
MSHIIGRGRYGRETYPPTRPPASGFLGCVLGVGADANEGVISLLTSAAPFLFPRQQTVQDNPLEVVLAEFNLGDALLIRYRIEWSYDPQAVAAPTSATPGTTAVVNLGSGYQFVGQGVGTALYSGSARIIQDDVGGQPPLLAATAGSILFTPAAFTALPRVAILTETDVPVDASNPVLTIAEDSGPAFLDVSRIKAGACVFQEPSFALSAPLSPGVVPFGP